MKRRRLLKGILLAAGVQALTALPSFAATFVEQVVSQLRAQGFEAIEVERTLLGRTRIAAVSADGSREIVLNPNTGEILRDLWLTQSADGTTKVTIDDNNADDGKSGSGSGEDGDDDEGGNSGHGGSDGGDNSGDGGDDGDD